MKKIKTNYADKMVDGKFYSKVNTKSQPTGEEFKGKPGYILAPYILGEHTKESSRQYDEFMKEYHRQHKCCPKCGGEQHTVTLVGYVLDWDKRSEYKDMNTCKCVKCGDVHSVHDRVI